MQLAVGCVKAQDPLHLRLSGARLAVHHIHLALGHGHAAVAAAQRSLPEQTRLRLRQIRRASCRIPSAIAIGSAKAGPLLRATGPDGVNGNGAKVHRRHQGQQ